MLIRVMLVSSLCLFGFACEKKGSGDQSGSTSASGGNGSITLNENGNTQSASATVKESGKAQEGVVTTPGGAASDKTDASKK